MINKMNAMSIKECSECELVHELCDSVLEHGIILESVLAMLLEYKSPKQIGRQLEMHPKDVVNFLKK
jgi:hypothetical protein